MAAEVPEAIKLRLEAKPLGRFCNVWINDKHVGGIRRVEFVADATDLTRVRMDFEAEITIEGEIFPDMYEAWQQLGVMYDSEPSDGQ